VRREGGSHWACRWKYSRRRSIPCELGLPVFPVYQLCSVAYGIFRSLEILLMFGDSRSRRSTSSVFTPPYYHKSDEKQGGVQYRHGDTRLTHNCGVSEQDLIELLRRNVAARKAKLGLTQEQIESRGELGQATVSGVLNGRAASTLKTLAGLAKALDCQPWELLVDDEATRAAYIKKALGG